MPSRDFEHAELVQIRDALCELRRRVRDDESIGEGDRQQRMNDLSHLWSKVQGLLTERPHGV